MLIDTTIIHQASATHGVLAHCCGVFWPGAGQVVLHAVQIHGATDPFHRAIQLRTGPWVLLDLRRLLPRCYSHDIATHPRRDWDDLTIYAIRNTYRCASDFEFAAAAKPKLIYTAPAALQRAAA